MPTRITENLVSWASDLDEGALRQALATSRLPVLAGPVGLMADDHFGLGATVGSVVATDSALLPSAVGVDIGCGMAAIETNLNIGHLPDALGALHRRLREAIPSGMGEGHARGEGTEPPALSRLGLPPGSGRELSSKEKAKVSSQFGSLGSGNHFAALAVDERDHLWLVLHAGSRWIGNHLGRRHIRAAKLVASAENQSLEERDLAWLAEGTPEFEAYVADMLWAQRYAWANREAMLAAALDALRRELPGLREQQRVQCHHNYATKEFHGGREVWVTRKGAIRAGAGELGIVPGSMGNDILIVRGRGNPASYESSAHGAGRRLGRKAAERQLSVESLREAMAGKAWDESLARRLVDEHPAAYKDLRRVMADQADLVDVVHTLTEVVNLKGA